MREFESWSSYQRFERDTRYRTRYVYDSDVGEFLATVLATSKSRLETIAKGIFLWRAQLGYSLEAQYQDGEHIGDFPSPFLPERMKPIAGRAMEGRANPKGIPYLYLATHMNTALAEVRPWIGSLVSVGQFKTLRDLTVVNCTTDGKGRRIYLGGEPSADEREKSVWYDIDQAFAKPISPSDDVADYVPTQIIAELFKAKEFDGVAYRSSLGEGHNVALFDLETTELINCILFEVKSVNFEFQQAANPYVVKKHYQERKDEQGGA